MSTWSIDGKTPTYDVMQQRIGAGTIGGDHVVPQSLAGKAIRAVIDDNDPRLSYGIATIAGADSSASLTTFRKTSFDTSGTVTKMTNFGAAVAVEFDGTSLGVLGRVNDLSSAIQVYVDGVLTSGRTLTFDYLSSSSYGLDAPLSASASSIAVGSVSSFPSSGTVLIDNELIAYTGVSGNTLTGCTRGANNTISTTHPWSAIVYLWASTAPLNYGSTSGGSTTTAYNYSTEQLVWYNPFLEPGHHRVVVVVIGHSAISGYNFYFDGFITGRLIGTGQVYISTGTTTLTQTTNPGGITAPISLTTRGDIAILGILGYDQISPAPGTSVAQLMLTDSGDGIPQFYLSGAANTTYTLRILLTYLGESV